MLYKQCADTTFR